METEKRKRGRPLGSCKDDLHLLRRVAELLISDKKMKPTTAIKRVLASPKPAPIRRLQCKWKEEGAKYLREAQTGEAHLRAEQSAEPRVDLNSPIVMMPQAQAVRSAAIIGDCYRTCFAIMLGLDAADVPHFCECPDEGEAYLAKARAWLATLNLSLAVISFTPKASYERALSALAQRSPGVPMIMIGGARGGQQHAVVVLDGNLYCDPACDGGLHTKPRGVTEAGDEIEIGYSFHILTPLISAKQEDKNG